MTEKLGPLIMLIFLIGGAGALMLGQREAALFFLASLVGFIGGVGLIALWRG